MAPTKGNVQKAQQKAARRELQQKKAAAKEQKKKQRKGEVDCDETPIEVLLQQLEEEQRQRQINKTQAVQCEQPSPRAHASLTLVPSGDFLLFGGESFDGKKVRVFGDLFKWDMDKAEWKRLEAPEMPKARCSHQAVYHNDALYIFGGEFSTYYQFHHFKDFWKFDLKTNLWSKILVESSTQVPSPRSGHRMVVWRGLLVLFGGFHDTGRDTRYYNDLYIFIFGENRWRKIEFPPHAHIPEARGGCVFIAVGDAILLHGGFAKIRDTNKRVQGKTFTDSWLLDLKPLAKGARTQTPNWEKIRNGGTPPSPRTGMCATGYKSSVIVFGGVADQDDGGTNLASVFFNDLYSFDMTKRRWYRLELKNGKKKNRKRQSCEQLEKAVGQQDLVEEQSNCENNADEESSDGEENWKETFAYFDAKGRLVKLRLQDFSEVTQPFMPTQDDAPRRREPDNEAAVHAASLVRGNEKNADTNETLSTLSEIYACVEAHNSSDCHDTQTQLNGSQAATKIDAAPLRALEAQKTPPLFSADMPLPRLHGMLCVRGSNLVLMGGIMELGSKEITLDDCWTLNLNKRDRWIRVLEGTMHEQEWQGADSDHESSNESDGDVSSSSGSSSLESDELDDGTSESDEEVPRRQGNVQRVRRRVQEEIQQLREQYDLDDPLETPAQGECLRDFFDRTRAHWIEKVSTAGNVVRNSKELTREAFEAASARVSFIRGPLHRIDELLRLDEDQAEEHDSLNDRHTGHALKRH
ncbi:kelch motif domain-containing protein, putative [Eimeria tenella]|uniref:Kelch motif domain-containing protein, putative n=1 Tax=Eimeria tenella TaxID=5802 RepID=U6KY93_EIMTE|nr:kelch motif domain-containing protein, putative [Eimeria tenella]CDJ40445.1 kelch motif domain-containing protein, putative [Eimeria tenella]|eukprot:XP_013231195.1 kelch motif domain-containing protein, putative [Eimeria tenella]